jgi:hypothetical protein
VEIDCCYTLRILLEDERTMLNLCIFNKNTDYVSTSNNVRIIIEMVHRACSHQITDCNEANMADRWHEMSARCKN